MYGPIVLSLEEGQKPLVKLSDWALLSGSSPVSCLSVPSA